MASISNRSINVPAGATCVGLVLAFAAVTACQPAPAPAYAFVLPRTATNPIALNQPHYAKPAVDIPVPVGTPFYAITAGTAVTFNDAYCGYGVQLNGTDGGAYVYCHASSRTFSGSRPVSAGAQLGNSGGRPGAPGAGNSSTPHLHFQLHYPASTLRCPQKLLIALYNHAAVPALSSLPTSGCVR
jgi:murein DD-endopeptidase MepM/ murein hydrolase activator NlpD